MVCPTAGANLNSALNRQSSAVSFERPKMLARPTKMLFLPFTLVFVLSLIGAKVEADHLEDNNGLPTIWSAINQTKQYHIMFQVQMLNSGERLTVEEWASFGTNQHRLDLISNNGRTTYLTNAKTGEIFTYRPYSCTLLEEGANELQLIAALFRGHPVGLSGPDGPKATRAFGLGPLWLNAKAEATSVVQFKEGSVRNFDVYDVKVKKDATKEFKYVLRFYFRKGFKFVDSIEWTSGETKSKKVLVQVRLKVVQMPTDEPIAGEIFDLPVGYGCVRSPNYDHPFQVNQGLKFLHEGAPNKAILEVILSHPKDSSHHLWQTNRYMVSLLRGTMKLNELVRSYYVSLVQFRHLASGKLSRRRKVWSDSSGSRSATAVLHSMNPDTGSCQTSHVPSADRLRLDLTAFERSMEQSVLQPPIEVSLDLLDWLFNNWDKFHLISEKPSAVSLILKEATYELRMNELRLDEKKAPIWPGPVSVVKEVLLMGQYVAHTFNINDIKQFDSYHQKVTLFFYSDDLTRVQYKISVNLFESTIVDMNHLLGQLDISGCILDERREEIVVEYPIEQEETRSSLVAMQESLLTLFGMNLFSTTPIDPLSVNHFEISFDQFSMQIRFHLLDVPLWQSFQMKAGLSLAADGGAALYEKLTGSLEGCSQACEHHNCLRFAFNQASKRCQLEVGLEQSLAVRSDVEGFVLFEAPTVEMRSPWIDVAPDGGKKHLRPHELLEILRHFVESPEQETADLPLAIKIEQPPSSGRQEFIALRPASIHSSLDHVNEIVRIAPRLNGNSSSSNGSGNNGQLIFVADRSKLRADYSILLENRDYAQVAKGDKEFGVASYDECAANCDDYNCRSFSYCETSKKCTVSKMHSSTELERNSKQAFTCSLSVLDYLTKFEPFGPAPLPIRATKVLHGQRTDRDCAHSCIEDQSISCQGFYFCPAPTTAKPKAQASKCYLEDRHIHDINPMGLESIAADQLAMGEGKRPAGDQARPCSFYSRSYLAQFDQFVGKSLDGLQSAPSHLEVEPDSGPDACARLCIERSCVAFDVCLDQNLQKLDMSAGRGQICRLLRNSVRGGDLSSTRIGCSTFVLSDRSQFSSPNTTVLDMKQAADYEALTGRSGGEQIVVDADQKEAQDGDIMGGLMEILGRRSSVGNKLESILGGGSNRVSKIISIMFGLFLGIFCAFFAAKKQINLVEQFEWRQLTDIFHR